MRSKQSVTLESMQRIFSLIDLTSLSDTDNAASIAALCAKTVLGSTHVAAVCVYPDFVEQVAKLQYNTPVHVATVVNFPEGNQSIEQVVSSIEYALEKGADEIDLVFPYHRFLAGDVAYADTFIRGCRMACGQYTLKVILETGAYGDDLKAITRASELVINAGADFLKTSTGKIVIGATLPAVDAILKTIKRYSSYQVGLKVSGGVRTLEQAREYIQLAENTMGVEWVTPTHFRLGASQLVDYLRAS